MASILQIHLRASALALICLLIIRGQTAQASIIVTSVGSPSFEVTDIHLFSAPIGTVATG